MTCRHSSSQIGADVLRWCAAHGPRRTCESWPREACNLAGDDSMQHFDFLQVDGREFLPPQYGVVMALTTVRLLWLRTWTGFTCVRTYRATSSPSCTAISLLNHARLLHVGRHCSLDLDGVCVRARTRANVPAQNFQLSARVLTRLDVTTVVFCLAISEIVLGLWMGIPPRLRCWWHQFQQDRTHMSEGWLRWCAPQQFIRLGGFAA